MHVYLSHTKHVYIAHYACIYITYYTCIYHALYIYILHTYAHAHSPLPTYIERGKVKERERTVTLSCFQNKKT